MYVKYTLTQGLSPFLSKSCSWQMNPRCSEMVPSSWSRTFMSVEIKNVLGERRFLICSWAPDILRVCEVWLVHSRINPFIFLKI